MDNGEIMLMKGERYAYDPFIIMELSFHTTLVTVEWIP
jgi:hypothetical protein